MEGLKVLVLCLIVKAMKEIIDIYPLLRMKKLLEKSLTLLENEELDELGQMGATQAFEVSCELVWKTLQKFLAREGTTVNSPRETFRLAAQFGYLVDPEVWFKFLKERNLTAHTYQEEILHELLNLLPEFIKELDQLINNLIKRTN